jgi:predicted transcriptional regulator
MLGKNRDSLSIVAAVLEAINPGTSKTRIMYQANLSFTVLKKYLDGVIQAGFVRVEASTYELTREGREFLRDYRKFYERYNDAQKLLEAAESEHDKLSHLCNKSVLTEPV